MKWGRKPIFWLALVGALILGMPSPESTRNQSQAAQNIFQSYAKPLRVPEFSLEDLQGKTIDIRDYKGKVILLNFWATW